MQVCSADAHCSIVPNKHCPQTDFIRTKEGSDNSAAFVLESRSGRSQLERQCLLRHLSLEGSSSTTAVDPHSRLAPDNTPAASRAPPDACRCKECPPMDSLGAPTPTTPGLPYTAASRESEPGRNADAANGTWAPPPCSVRAEGASTDGSVEASAPGPKLLPVLRACCCKPSGGGDCPVAVVPCPLPAPLLLPPASPAALPLAEVTLGVRSSGTPCCASPPGTWKLLELS